MIGQLVTSKAGHDRDTLYVIVSEEGEFVHLADGRGKTPDAPKKKRRKHIQPINAFVADELAEKLKQGTKVYPEEIRYALKQYSINN